MQPPASASIREHVATLSDPRGDHTKQHALLDIIAIALRAVIRGGDGWTEVGSFGQAKPPWPRALLALPYGLPSHDAFRRVFAALDPGQFQQCFLG